MRIFVYGTLKKGYENHRVIANAKFLGKHVTDPKYTMYDMGAYPCITLGGDTAIVGEVYEVDSLRRTDVLEGYPVYYNRIEIETEYGTAWVYYYYPSEESKVIGSGEWLGE